MTTHDKLRDLRQFTGSEHCYRHGLNRAVLYTDGAKYVAEQAGAYWLLDEIALAQRFEPAVKAEAFQLWKLVVKPDNTAQLICEDGNRRMVHRKDISVHGFPGAGHHALLLQRHHSPAERVLITCGPLRSGPHSPYSDSLFTAKQCRVSPYPASAWSGLAARCQSLPKISLKESRAAFYPGAARRRPWPGRRPQHQWRMLRAANGDSVHMIKGRPPFRNRPALVTRRPDAIRRRPDMIRRSAPPVIRPVPARSAILPPLPATMPGIADHTGQPDPYLDYGRFLTPEGGVLIIFKDIDERLRHTLWRIFAWSAATGFDLWLLVHYSPVHSWWINAVCGLAAAGLNLFIVWKAVEVYRRLEIRPDCLILEGGEVFWRRHMEAGWPSLEPDKDKDDIFKLRGIFGSRHVEFATLRRFDEFDRMPEVFAAHLAQAFEQLWSN